MTRMQRVTIPFEVHASSTAELVPGTVKVIEPGRDGRGIGTFLVTIVNGEVDSQQLIGRWIERAPVTEERLSAPQSVARHDRRPRGDRRYPDRRCRRADPPWSGPHRRTRRCRSGTLVTVTDLETGRSVTVTINDRGPFGTGRIIDLSPEAFAVLQPLGAGILDVSISW